MKLPTPKQREFFASAAESYARQLAADTAAQAYLMSRGIDASAAGTYHLGVVNEPLVGHESYRGRLAIPYVTPAGIVNFNFRCLKQHDCKEAGCVKYLAPPTDRNLYNVMAIAVAIETGEHVIHICEGELDALTLSVAGLLAVGVPGVDNWQKHWGLCFKDFGQIFVWGDGDKAGSSFALKMEKELLARRVAVPRGKDVNSVYIDGGAAALHALVAA